MATRVLIILISSLVVYSSGQISVSELEEYSTNRTIEENGVFVYSCEVTKELIEIGNDNDTLQVCVNIEQMMQQLDGGFLRLANEIQHARDKVLRSYTHGNEVDGTLAKFKVLHRQDYKNRTEKDPEYVVVIPSGSIVYCSFGPPQETCKDTFLNGSIPLRYIVEGISVDLEICLREFGGITAGAFVAGLLMGSITVFLVMMIIIVIKWKKMCSQERNQSV